MVVLTRIIYTASLKGYHYLSGSLCALDARADLIQIPGSSILTAELRSQAALAPLRTRSHRCSQALGLHISYTSAGD